jgi:hypothetical protein
MTVSIDTASIKITFDDKGSDGKQNKPRVKLFPKAKLNYGHGVEFPGYAKFELPPVVPKFRFTNGFWAEAGVKFLMDPGETPAGWKVGFVQFDKKDMMTAAYAGRTHGEGGIVIIPTKSDDWRKDSVALDVPNGIPVPWYNNPVSMSTDPVATLWMGDGPDIDVPLMLPNSKKSGVQNHLLGFDQHNDFWTVLSATDPGGSRQYLAHFHWSLQFLARFKWHAGDPQILLTDFKFDMDKKVIMGPPTQPELASHLANPVGPLANRAFIVPWENAIRGTDPKGRMEFDDSDHAMIVPNDFWT